MATKAIRKAPTAESEEARAQAPAQAHLPGVPSSKVPEIEKAAIALRRTREDRARSGEKAKQQAAALCQILRSHNRTTYRCEDEELLVTLTEKEAVRVEPPGDEE